jgi:NADH-quinone oxidoreductase subunit N
MLVAIIAIAATTFALVAALATYSQLVHSDRIRDLAGMSVHAPGTALLLAVALASLIGLPPLAGFFGKVLPLEAAVGGGFAWLALLGALNALLAAAVFAPVVRTAYFEGPLFEVEQPAPSWPRTVVLGFAGVALLAFGVFLGPLSTWADAGARALLG